MACFSLDKNGGHFCKIASSNGRFAASPSDMFLSSVPSICCVVSSVSAACLLMQALLSVTWNFVCDGVWVCSCILSKNSSNGEGLILA